MSVVTNKEDIIKTLGSQKHELKKYGIEKIALFGSFVRNEQKKGSDIDFLVQFSKGAKKYDNFINLAYYLEELLGKKVDLVTKESLSPYIKPYIIKEIQYVSLR